MNSIPQQDVANGNGQMEFFRASPTTFSRLVAKKPVPSIPSGFSEMLITFELLVAVSILHLLIFPVQRTFLYQIKETHQQQADEYDHLNESFDFQFFKIDSPGIHENYHHVKQHKQD